MPTERPSITSMTKRNCWLMASSLIVESGSALTIPTIVGRTIVGNGVACLNEIEADRSAEFAGIAQAEGAVARRTCVSGRDQSELCRADRERGKIPDRRYN